MMHDNMLNLYLICCLLLIFSLYEYALCYCLMMSTPIIKMKACYCFCSMMMMMGAHFKLNHYGNGSSVKNLCINAKVYELVGVKGGCMGCLISCTILNNGICRILFRCTHHIYIHVYKGTLFTAGNIFIL